MFGLGTQELIIILIIVLVIFGAGKLPEVGGALGKGIRNFKRAAKGQEDLDVTPADPTKPDALQKPQAQRPESPRSPAPAASNKSSDA